MKVFRPSYFSFLLIATLITGVCFVYLEKPATGIDDGCIFLTYAKHVSQGEGFVFNTGGEKVEGFTSLLWVLICALFYKIFAAPEIPLIIFLLLLSAASLTLVYNELKKTVDAENKSFSERWLFLTFVLFIICIGAAWFTWSVLTLMENGIWNFLFLCSTMLILKLYRTGNLSTLQKSVLVSSSALLLLTRPEALMWCTLFTIAIGFSAWQNRRSFGFTFLFAAVQLITAFVLTQFRTSYFGYPLPNTYYAKVSHNRWYNLREGAEYLISFLTGFNFLISFLFVLLCVALVFVVTKGRSSSPTPDTQRKNIPSFFIAGLFVLAGLAVPMLTGGDHFGSYRFYQGMLPLFFWALPAFFWLRNKQLLSSWMGVGNVWMLVAVGAGLLFGGKTLINLKIANNTTQLGFEFYLAKDGRQLGDMLNTMFAEKKPSAGVIVVGGFSLHYKGETIDLMGLNNVAMGHSKGERIGIKNHAAFNKEVFYQLNPDLLMPRPVADSLEAKSIARGVLQLYNFDNMALKNIFNDSVFQQRFQPVYLERNGVRIFSFVNRSQIQSIQSLAGSHIRFLR